MPGRLSSTRKPDIRQHLSPSEREKPLATEGGTVYELQLSPGTGLELSLAKAATRKYNSMVERGIGGIDKLGISELTFCSCRQAIMSTAKKRRVAGFVDFRSGDIPGKQGDRCPEARQ